jgi:Flp pilus assembly protein TadD
MVAAGEREKFLRNALAEKPNDPELLTDMGYLYQTHGKLQRARQLYERALQIEPLETVAAADLGAIDTQTGNLQEAVQLWETAFEREPSNITIGKSVQGFMGGRATSEGARGHQARAEI